MLLSKYVVRALILLFLALIVALIARPFVLTSRALDAHGVILPGTVYHKSEYVKTLYSSWELSREVTIQYTIPETSSAGFFAVRPDAATYDSLHTKQAVDVRYLPRKDVPEVWGAHFWWDIHALPIAKLATIPEFSRFDALKTPNAILGAQILGGIVVLLILWRITRTPLLGWAAAAGVLPLVALVLLQGFPRPTQPPLRDVRHGSGRVVNIGYIDKLFAGSRSRGFIAAQPVDVVSIEFVPAGQAEPVVAVDAVDHGSVPNLREQSTVAILYEAASPRTAYLDGASRRFPESNLTGVISDSFLSVATVVVLLGLTYVLGRGYRRLLKRSP